MEVEVRSGIGMETTCGAVITELEHIWNDIGETEAEKERMLLELEIECMKVCRKKVEESNDTRAKLHQSLIAQEAELASLVASLGEHNAYIRKDKTLASLKDQLAYIKPLLEDLRTEKEERIKQFKDVISQIKKLKMEISGQYHQNDSPVVKVDEHDLSIRKLNDYQAQLRNLQKEKVERIGKVLENVNEVHSLCSVLGVNFRTTLDEVHPSLKETDLGKSTNISDIIFEKLTETIQKLKTEKRVRTQKFQETVKKITELWTLIDSSEEEKLLFEGIINAVRSQEITQTSVLSRETIEKVENEVNRLQKVKAARMKELVLRRRAELEEICREAHIEPDENTAPEKTCAMIDSGLVDPSGLVESIEAQIAKANEELMIRREIMDKLFKWQIACEEEIWLEEYNQDQNKYNAGRGAHLDLKRAEKARVTVTKIPAMVENLINRTFVWEGERNTPFLYDGVRLISLLEDYKFTRQQKEEEKKHHRDMKRLQSLLKTEKELRYGSKPSPNRSNSFNKKGTQYPNGKANGFMTPSPRRVSMGNGILELQKPHSYSGRQNGFFKETRQLSTAPLNFVAITKDDTISSFASVSASERSSPPRRVELNNDRS